MQLQFLEKHGTVFGRSGLERRLIRILEQAGRRVGSVDAAQEEHAVPSTVPASSGVLRAAGHVEVIPMFDGSADASEHEVEAVPVGRWRLVLVSQGSHVSQSGEGRLEDDRGLDDNSIDGVSVVSDVFVAFMFQAHCQSIWIPDGGSQQPAGCWMRCV